MIAACFCVKISVYEHCIFKFIYHCKINIDYIQFQVVSFYTENGNYFVELVPIISIKDGKAKQQFNITDTSARRRKRADLSLTTSAYFSMQRDEKVRLPVIQAR